MVPKMTDLRHFYRFSAWNGSCPAGARPRIALGVGPAFAQRQGNQDMAKGQKKSNKEVRKPKQAKTKGKGVAAPAKGLGPKMSQF
jgi:hypothetical protein